MSDKLATTAILAGALWLAGDFPANAETEGLWSHFAIEAGAYDISTADKVRVSGDIDLADRPVDLSADVGLPDSKTLLSARLDWAFAERHSLELGYYSLDRAGSKSIVEQVEIGGLTFPVGATAAISFKSQMLEVAYTGWFVRHEDFGMGLSLGLVYLKLDARASATATFPGGGGTISRSGSANTDLPVPMIGLAIKGRPASRLVLFGNARFLPSVTVGDYSGEAGSYAVGVQFFVWGPLALGASYDGQYFKADVDRPDWNGSMDLTYDGFRLFLRAAF